MQKTHANNYSHTHTYIHTYRHTDIQEICRGLVVTMPDSQAQVRRFNSPLDPHAGKPGHHINVWHCGGLCMVLLQLKHHKSLNWKYNEIITTIKVNSKNAICYIMFMNYVH